MAGWTKAWRKEVRSSIWDMPPLYHRVFLWLRYKVEHKTTLFPTRRRFGIWTNPGQILTSVRNIAEGVSWVEDGKDKTPNVKTIKGILIWLEGEGAIKAISNTFGTFISLENWDTYQAQESQEVTANGQPNGQPNGHTLRRGKKVKEKDLKELLGENGFSIKEMVGLHQRSLAVIQVPPILLKDMREILENHSQQEIEKAYMSAANAGVRNFNYVKAALRGDSKPRGGRKDARSNEEQPSGEAAEYANFWK